MFAAPYWDSTARGTICGLTQCVTKAHIARAALKAVTLQTSEIIEAVEHDLDGEIKIHTIKVDGGMTANKLFNQMQADTLGRPIVCSKMAEIRLVFKWLTKLTIRLQWTWRSNCRWNRCWFAVHA